MGPTNLIVPNDFVTIAAAHPQKKTQTNPAGHIAEAISTTTIDAPPPAVISNSSVAIFQRSATSLGHGVWWDGSSFFGGVGETSGWDAVFCNN